MVGDCRASDERPRLWRPNDPLVIYSEPTYHKPTYSKLSYSEPAYSKPIYSQPTYTLPTYSKHTNSNMDIFLKNMVRFSVANVLLFFI